MARVRQVFFSDACLGVKQAMSYMASGYLGTNLIDTEAGLVFRRHVWRRELTMFNPAITCTTSAFETSVALNIYLSIPMYAVHLIANLYKYVLSTY